MAWLYRRVHVCLPSDFLQWWNLSHLAASTTTIQMCCNFIMFRNIMMVDRKYIYKYRTFSFKSKLPHLSATTLNTAHHAPFPGNISDFIESGTNDNFWSFSRLLQCISECISEHVEMGVIQHCKSQVDLLYLWRDCHCACPLTLQSTLACWNWHLFKNYNAQARFTLWKAVQTPVCHITRSWWTWSSQANICDTILFRKI